MKTVFAVLLLFFLSANCALLWRIDSRLSDLFPTTEALATKDREALRATFERLPAVRLASPYVFIQTIDPLPVEIMQANPVSVKIKNTEKEAVPVGTPLLSPLDVRFVK